jgi:hypothetical protein
MTNEPNEARPPRPHRLRRVLAVAAGVAVVPALFAAANAATGSGTTPSTTVAARAASDNSGTELEQEHGVVVEKPHGGAPTPSVPEVTTPTLPSTTTPSPTAVTTPEVEHPNGDDNGNDAIDDHRGDGTAALTPLPSFTQGFSAAGGSIDVTVANGAVSLASSAPAAGFTQEVHDNGPTRVEVRFDDGSGESRIRVELVNGALTSEITAHG